MVKSLFLQKMRMQKATVAGFFFKTLSRGNIPSQAERLKRRSEDPTPWVTAPAVDNEPICDDDGRPWYESEADRRRLNSLLSVLRSNDAASQEPSKEDTVDGTPSQPDASKLQSSTTDPKRNVLTLNLLEKPISSPSQNIGEQLLPTSKAASSDDASNLLDKVVSTTSNSQSTPTPTFGSIQSPLPNSTALFVAKEKSESLPPSSQVPAAVISTSTSLNPTSAITSLPVPSITPASDASSVTQSASLDGQSKIVTSVASMAPSGLIGSPSTATFTLPQQAVKPPITTTSTFTFGANVSAGVSSTLVSSSSFGLPTSSSISTPAVSSLPQPTAAPSFTTLSQNPSTVVSTNFTISKSVAPPSSSGGFSFGHSPSAEPSTTALGGFSIPKTATSTAPFGMGSTPTSAFSSTSTVTSPQTSSTVVTTNTDATTSKPFGFGATQPTAAPASGTGPSAGGFNFQFGSGTQSNLTAPKPQESSAGFKFSFGPNKEGGGLSAGQPSTNPIAKPPAFGEGFNFGASSSNVNSEDSKPMTCGTPTLTGPAATTPTSGFNFTPGASASASIPKPAFGFGSNNSGSGATGSVLGSSEGFSFGAKTAEPPAVAPAQAAPNLGSPFQFGTNSQVMPSSSTLQPQAQTVNSPFSIGAATEQKPSVLGGGFSFGSTPSASIPPLQQSTPAFGQSSAPNFGSPTINPLQNQQAAPSPSLFQFGSGGSAMPQPANPLQPGMYAPAMFSIGSGSTAPRSRPRNRRQK